MTRSWVPGADGSGYGVDHLPYGVFARPGESPRAGARIGGYVLDLAAALHDEEFAAPSLNPFLARGRTAWRETRELLRRLLAAPGPGLTVDEVSANRSVVEPHLLPLETVETRLPVEVGDFADFYCSLDHASNVGRMLRPGADPLPPNWRHLPAGYHGRAGTVVVSGTPVTRPSGQLGARTFGPSEGVDFEAELGFVVGAPSAPGSPAGAFDDHVFGVALVNDWSARDIQLWETVPLGPFLGKSFATSMSAWITPLDALAPARVDGPVQDPEPLPYLRRREPWGLDLAFEVRLNGHVVARPPYRGMYWTPDQMLAHLTANGASLRTGDLYASGTVSGPRPDQRGCLLELGWNGATPLELPDGTRRAYLRDGDTVTITAGFGDVTLGEVTGAILPRP